MGRKKSSKKRAQAVPLQQLKRRDRSPSPDRKPLLDANASHVPEEPPEYAYDPAPNSYAITPTPVQDLPTVSDIHRELRPEPKGMKDQVKCCMIEDPFNPVTPRYGDRLVGANHAIRSPRVSKFRCWMSVIIPLLMLSTGVIVIACILYKNQHRPKCVRFDIKDSENLQCGDDDMSAKSIPKCHGLPMMRIGNATAEFEGQVWKAWTYAHAFGEQAFACTSLNEWWECREIGCEGQECEKFSSVCANEGEEDSEDETDDEEESSAGFWA